MKTLKLEFYEKKTQQRALSSPVTLEFRGHWKNNDQMPVAKLTFTGCNAEIAEDIQSGLDLTILGETLYLIKGENPQKTIDQWLIKAVKRKTPKVSDFVAEIKDLEEDEKKERYELLFNDLTEAARDGRQDSKKWEFLFACMNHLRIDLWDMEPLIKEAFITDLNEPQVEYGYEKSKKSEPEFEPVTPQDEHDEPEEDTDDWDE